MQHDPDIGCNRRWIKRLLCSAQKFFELSCRCARAAAPVPQGATITRSVFSLFPSISAGQARAPAPRVPANRRRGATNGRERNAPDARSCCVFPLWPASAVALAAALSAQARAQIGSDRYSSIVVDAATGNVLEAANPDAPRHPASLAKLMTLYLAFEALRDRRDHQPADACRCRPRAAATPPTKLGLVPGHAAYGGGGDPRPGHQVRQRRGRRARRTAGRCGGPVRPDDDPARPCARA